MHLAVRVEGLGKRYRIGAAVARKSAKSAGQVLTAPIRNLKRLRGLASFGAADDEDIVWALRDVSFDVRHGDAVGIVGRNGSGKSTLLKILSRITAPSTGYAEVQGRVGSLLEVGTGFHGELTGRENIFLNGAILGMSRAYIDSRLDEIIDFAGVGRFIDTPVKRYSSGMYLRLAFAVAAHLEPEILLVDEVLAVGDAEFQRKCLTKMGDVAREGRTVLFVSHNMVAVTDLCRRAIWLNHGKLEEMGPSSSVVSRYLQKTVTATTERRWEDAATAPGSDTFRLRSARVYCSNGPADGHITVRTPIEIEILYESLEPGAHLNVNLQVFNGSGILLFEGGPMESPIWRPLRAGLHRDVCLIPKDLLNNGHHRIGLNAVTVRGTVVYSNDDLLGFEVHDTTDFREGWYGDWPGAVRPLIGWRREFVQELADVDRLQRG